MQVTVRFFASHRDIVGASERRYELEDGATVGGLWEQLVTEHPRLGGFTGRLLFAVNEQFATPATALQSGDGVAFIPPVSGGIDFRFAILDLRLSRSARRGYSKMVRRDA